MSRFAPFSFWPRLRAPGIRGRLAMTFGCMSVLLSLCLALIVGNASTAQLEAQTGRLLSELAYQAPSALVNDARALADSLDLQRRIVLWGLALGAAFALWGVVIARHLAAPIRTLADAADRVRQGERELHLPPFQIREFATLASSLTNMVATLAAQEQALKEAMDGLERRVEERTRELRRTEARLREAAYRDPLTGLPNRLMFQEQLRLDMAHATQYDRKLALMFLDLDRFKAINDTLGHDAGDLLLKQVADALSGSIRGGDLVARLAGDEFTLILSDVEDADDVRVVAERIVAALSRPFDLNGVSVQAGASIGIALFPSDGTEIAALLKKADVAMYLAKRKQNGYQFYAEAYELAKL